MADKTKPPNQINFLYKFSDNYNPKYVNGAYGGVNPTGEIVVNFYLQRIPIPKKVEQEFKEGILGKELKIEPETHGQNLIRFVETGVVLNLTSAKELHGWLGNQIVELEKRMTGTKK